LHVCVPDIVVGPVGTTTSAARGRVSGPATVSPTARMTSDVGVVVDVRDVHFGDVRIGDVHAIEVTAAHAIPRNVRFAEAERAPAISAPASAEPDAYAPAGTAKPRHQGGRIIRPHIDRSGRPSPIIVVVDPASIMEGSIAPRFVVDPSPAPRINPNPVTIAIRCPSRADTARNPHIAVFSGFLPCTV